MRVSKSFLVELIICNKIFVRQLRIVIILNATRVWVAYTRPKSLPISNNSPEKLTLHVMGVTTPQRRGGALIYKNTERASISGLQGLSKSRYSHLSAPSTLTLTAVLALLTSFLHKLKSNESAWNGESRRRWSERIENRKIVYDGLLFVAKMMRAVRDCLKSPWQRTTSGDR